MTASTSSIAQASDRLASNAVAAVEGSPHTGLTVESARPFVAEHLRNLAGPFQTGLVQALVPMYLASWAAGEHAARDAIRRRTLTKADNPDGGEPETPAEFIAEFGLDWETWTPGDLRAAGIVYDQGLKDLLLHAVGHSSTWASRATGRGSILASIADTRLGKLGDVLAEALAAGDSTDTLTKTLTQVLDTPTWAGLVSTTETARAMTAATLQTYVAHQVPGKEFLTADDDRVCVLCDANEAEGPVPLTDRFVNGDPPVHPACRCALLPALALEAGESEPNEEDTG